MPTMAPPEDALKERFARFDERFDRVDERIVDVGNRVTETAKETDRRIKEVDRRIAEGKDETNRRLADAKEEANHRFDRVEGDIRDLKKSVEAIQATLTRISFGLALTFASVLLTRGL
jgi:hypothetical protein